MSSTVDDHESVTPDAFTTMPLNEIERQVDRSERLIAENRACEREYALYISAMRELLRRTGVRS